MPETREQQDVRRTEPARSRPPLPRARPGKGRRPLKRRGLTVDRLFTQAGENPFEQVAWERRKTSITDDKGKQIFVQENVEVPRDWSTLAANVVSSKYFFGPQGTPARETSVRQLIHRVTRTIADWGQESGYFASTADSQAFYDELSHLCLNQYGSFNSPVWFNVGLHQVYGHTSPTRTAFAWDEAKREIGLVTNCYERPQASACFIQAVDDTMEDIMRLAAAEAMLFKFGSGTGTDLSTLRSSRERLSGGGVPSGPLSFMRVYDQIAAVIKSGGKTRRAAKMQSLKVSHPDIMDFVCAKMREEKKAWALIEQGYDGSFGGEAYDSVMYQNANLSVRVTDTFMQRAEEDGEWETLGVLDDKPVDKLKARELLKKIAEGTHVCGDPGVQYDSTINRWHTCLNAGRINASNPCSEFMFLDNSACNLASLNLMRFTDADGEFDLPRFRHAVRLFITAQDILVDRASYPTREIARNSHAFRPLGLGYANLGAMIMRLGLPYDSDQGRALAGAITAFMTSQAYLASIELADIKGPFDGFEANRDCMNNVMQMHLAAVSNLDPAICPPRLHRAAVEGWREVVQSGGRSGFRNAQVTLLAPTGTIGFMMDCDTTGVEPDIALVKYKQLAGGGTVKIVNNTLQPALRALGYAEDQVQVIAEHVEQNDTVEGAPGLRGQDLPVFDCAFKPRNGKRFIPYRAHLKMMAAVQPFLSGAISKTVNMPAEATVGDVMQAYVDGWKLGLKSLAIYRDGSKRTQPLNTGQSGGKAAVESKPDPDPRPFRKRMPATRQSITHKFEVAGHEGYLTVGMHGDGSPGELFITMAKEGSTVGGTMDAFGTAISLCLQYGVPVQELCQKFAHSRFEPSGFTKNPDIPIAKSIVDYIFRWLDMTFPGGKAEPAKAALEPTAGPPPAPRTAATQPAPETAAGGRVDEQFEHFMDDAPACDLCGAITVRNGACYRCYNCGNSMGCS